MLEQELVRQLTLSSASRRQSSIRRSLFYGTERNGTEQFRHIILRNETGSNAHTTAKYIAIKLPTVVLAFPVSKDLYILAVV